MQMDQNKMIQWVVQQLVEMKLLIMRSPHASSIFSTGITALKLALSLIKSSNHDRFLIFSDSSLSVLISLANPNNPNPVIQNILKSYYEEADSNSIIFCWILSHIKIKENEEANEEANDTLNLPITNIKIPHIQNHIKKM